MWYPSTVVAYPYCGYGCVVRAGPHLSLVVFVAGSS